MEYKEQYGNANAPERYKTSDGFNLGNWQAQQRQNYYKNQLSLERILRLKGLGFMWYPRLKTAEEFEKGLHESLQHKKKFGTPNAFKHYKTPEGYQLGQWQTAQRHHYKKGKLSSDRIKRLEEIGFKWETWG